MRNLIRSLAGGFISGLGATGAMSLVTLGANRFLWRTRRRPLRQRRQNALAVASHFGFGGLMGALFGAVEPRLGQQIPRPIAGMLFGSTVWALSYAGIRPALGIWIYGAVLGGSTHVIRRTLRLAARR